MTESASKFGLFLGTPMFAKIITTLVASRGADEFCEHQCAEEKPKCHVCHVSVGSFMTSFIALGEALRNSALMSPWQCTIAALNNLVTSYRYLSI